MEKINAKSNRPPYMMSSGLLYALYGQKKRPVAMHLRWQTTYKDNYRNPTVINVEEMSEFLGASERSIWRDIEYMIAREGLIEVGRDIGGRLFSPGKAVYRMVLSQFRKRKWQAMRARRENI